jgi:hypothetical protein
MPFDLKDSNLTGLSIIDQPGGLIATKENFITLYDYAQQYQPELIPDLVYANGKGSIQGFLQYATKGKEDSYASDTIQHGETNRLHNVLKDVAVSGNNFTSPTPHNLRVNQVVKISDGVEEAQAMVTAITSATVFVAANDAAGAFDFAGNVTVLADFSNRFNKGDNTFAKGRNWNPVMYTNYTHILKERYDVSESNMAHKTWVMTSAGPMWFNFEMERTNTLFDNLCELTNVLHTRADDSAASTTAGFAQGVKGVVQQIEERGNISNDYITTTDDLSKLALRAKQQGACREFTIFADHQQMAYFRILSAGVNASFVNGAYYGAFNNSKDMALKLDFSSILIDGVTFHFSPWRLLDDPTLLGAANFKVTSLAFIMIPTGMTDIMVNGDTKATPYLTLRYRRYGNVNRRRKVEFFGLLGTPQYEDKTSLTLLSEFTNQVAGANSYYVGRKGDFYTDSSL